MDRPRPGLRPWRQRRRLQRVARPGLPRCLRGGASLYGVSDPLALARCTHKFEGDYLDWLIGDPLRQRRRYLVRSPVLQVGRIRAPVVFFQGGLDAVVVPEQTEAMVAGLRAAACAWSATAIRRSATVSASRPIAPMRCWRNGASTWACWRIERAAKVALQ